MKGRNQWQVLSGERNSMISFYIIKAQLIDNLMQKYEILSAIGQGAYGVVLKCRDIEAKIYVAIKKFKESDEEEHTRKTTMREVKILKLAVHDSIVELKEAFRKKGIVYLVFEYVQNNLLEVLQKSPSGLRIPVIRTLMYQLLKGLAYLHELNIVHRDIKPENLLVSKDNRLKICDFGFARQIKEKDEGLTDYVATRWYRPAELLVGGEYGKEIDLWAVGCIMCQLLDGNPLFPGENELDQLFLIQKCLGNLPADLQEKFLKNQRFLGMKFPEIHNHDKLEKKYFGKICPKGLSLIKGLLKLDPSQRLTAAQALQHPFFEPERMGEGFCDVDRKEAYTAATNRKKESELSVGQGLAERTKYGKIYNKRGKGFDQVTQIYQSSNNCKLNFGGAKSLGKQQKKHTYNQEMSLEKHRNKDVLMKTEARGFYFDSGQQKLSAYGDNSKKSTQIGSVPSHKQLPFLIYSQQTSGDDTFRRHPMATTTGLKEVAEGKKKTQLMAHRQTFNIKQITANR